MGRDVVPELRLGEDNKLAVAISLLTAPEIDEAGEGTLVMGEVQPPDTCELGTVISRGAIVALEEALVEQLNRPGLGEIGIVTVVGYAKESGMLVAACDMIHAAIVLDMGGDG